MFVYNVPRDNITTFRTPPSFMFLLSLIWIPILYLHLLSKNVIRQLFINCLVVGLYLRNNYAVHQLYRTCLRQRRSQNFKIGQCDGGIFVTNLCTNIATLNICK